MNENCPNHWKLEENCKFCNPANVRFSSPLATDTWLKEFQSKELEEIYTYANVISQKLTNITGFNPTELQKDKSSKIRQLLNNTIRVLNANGL